DPISKDRIVIPPPDNVSVENRYDGVVIKNNGKYTLYVEKSSLDDKNCSEQFKFLTKIPAGGTFIDKDVIQTYTYSYRITNLDEEIRVESVSKDYSIIYAIPIEVNGFEIIPSPNGYITMNLNFSSKPRYFKVFLNGKEVGKFNNDNITLLLEDIESNEIVIIAYDKFNNQGVAKRIIYSNPRSFYLYPPEKFEIIEDENFKFIHWESVPYAIGYRLYDFDTGLLVRETKVNYIRLDLKGCKKFYLTSFNDKTESEKKLLDLCKNNFVP
ncbi:MAG: hypothetical protein K6348_09880, partial [Deferribacterales bacterium]